MSDSIWPSDRAYDLLKELYLDKGVVPTNRQGVAGHMKNNPLLFPPDYFAKGYPPKGIFYEKGFKELQEKALRDKNAFQALNNIAAAWVESKQPIPDYVSQWTKEALTQKALKPKKQGKSTDYQKREVLWKICNIIHEEFGIQYDKNDASFHDDYIFAIVASAAQSLKIPGITDNTVRDAYKHHAYQKRRNS